MQTPAVWADFGWRATHLSAVAGKKIAELVYGRFPTRAYFVGQSTGGQQALSEAEKFPADFDGIIAEAPGNNRIWLHVYFLWLRKCLIRKDGTRVFSQEDLQRISDTAIAFCRENGEGAPRDRFVSNSFLAAEQRKRLLEKIGALGLSEEQLTSVRNMYEGPTNPRTGEKVFCGMPVGAEADPPTVEMVMADNFVQDFLYPIRWGMGEAMDAFDMDAFDFDDDIEMLRKLELDLNAETADLQAFKELGGKMIIFSGASDGLVPPMATKDYYDRIIAKQGGLDEARKFCRYFVLPGFGHGFRTTEGMDWVMSPGEEIAPAARFLCGVNFSLLQTLVNWVEKDEAPEELRAIRFKGAPAMPWTVNAAEGIELERPIYPYPDKAVYIGGDAAQPSSFARESGELWHEPIAAAVYWKR